MNTLLLILDAHTTICRMVVASHNSTKVATKLKTIILFPVISPLIPKMSDRVPRDVAVIVQGEVHAPGAERLYEDPNVHMATPIISRTVLPTLYEPIIGRCIPLAYTYARPLTAAVKPVLIASLYESDIEKSFLKYLMKK